MISGWRNYLQTINKWPARNRVLLFIVILAATFFIWKFLLWDNLRQKEVKLNVQTKTAYTEIQTLEKALKNGQENILKNILAQKQTVENSAYSHLVPAQEMTQVLKDLLFARHNLELLKLENLPVKVIIVGDPKAKVKEELYEYGIIIEFKGSYFAVMNYLKDLEKLKWAFFWDKFNYDVTKYPNAEVTLQLHTLSNQKGWIHV